jgi:transposase
MAPKNRRRRAAPPSASSEILNTLKHPDAGGVDVGAEELVAAVPMGRAAQCVQTFSSFTSGVNALRDWFLECGIKTVAIESTGNYWITLYAVLEDAGIEVYLVNARHAKGVPGKKTDVCDAQWLQQLHQAGLLRRSFRPHRQVVPMRYLMRHRAELICEASRQVQRMQKVLTEMNLHLHHVFSDLDGQSAQRIINSILDGERDPQKLAKLRDGRCRAPLSRVLQALEGDYRPELLFVLRQCQERREQIVASIAACDQEIARLCAEVSSNEEPAPPESPQPPQTCTGTEKRESKRSAGKHKNDLGFAVQQEALRFYGVDLCSIDGVGTSTLAVLMSEVGTREQMLKAFPSSHAFSSWLGLCPDTRITGGKVIRSKTRRVKSRLAHALRMAAQGVRNSRSELGRLALRLGGRLGKAEGITATAHKLARILYGVIASKRPYDEATAFRLTPAKKQRQIRMLLRKAQAMGMQLVPAV